MNQEELMAPTSKTSTMLQAFLKNPMTGNAIEERSLQIIDSEASGHNFDIDQWAVVKRMIHTTADFAMIRDVRFSKDAIDAAVSALTSGVPIFVDSNMIRTGISIARLRNVNPGYSREKIFCHVSDDDVYAGSMESGLPRSLHAARKGKQVMDGGIAVFGNAPVALMELNHQIIKQGVRPALVIAMPVGFVHVVESKEELMSLDVPYIAIAGRRGGSPLAVSCIHALCDCALNRL
jgi:precorrin-8X/cobalt-precorrin-8 methylmutase